MGKKEKKKKKKKRLRKEKKKKQDANKITVSGMSYAVPFLLIRLLHSSQFFLASFRPPPLDIISFCFSLPAAVWRINKTEVKVTYSN